MFPAKTVFCGFELVEAPSRLGLQPECETPVVGFFERVTVRLVEEAVHVVHSPARYVPFLPICLRTAQLLRKQLLIPATASGTTAT
ncbi:hypothetical protein Y032_0120g892 [Ancylostoma ceylanicum]|uniref:Uncharacterized protein n=1 Tax=Ancylostoma ceylanicum TaxID=53326 RepID=A0A016TAP8_9BILA|nr:hypothetical protein Y032_0120g892 [Ancylostoma ceylanicum]